MGLLSFQGLAMRKRSIWLEFKPQLLLPGKLETIHLLTAGKSLTPMAMVLYT